MDPAEEQQLRELQAELAAAEQSPWQPRCIGLAFARDGESFVLTMQGWIDLDHLRSPLLEGKLPGGEDALQQIADALGAFNRAPEAILQLDPEEAAILAGKMLGAVHRAFSTALRMMRPNSSCMDAADGFGTWLPILTCLISQIGLSRQDALDCPVDQAFALIATDKHNAGWIAAGETYAQRDAGETKSKIEETIP